LRKVRRAQTTWADRLGTEIGEDVLRAINERLPMVIDALERQGTGPD
jgi:hypothetical protein